MRRRDLLAGLAVLPLLGAISCTTSSQTAAPAPADDLDAAFFYAFPLYEIARTGQNRAARPGLNRLGHRAALADHTAREITAPNNDTVYSSGQLDLSGGPMEVFAPTDTSRYFNIAFMDAFTDNFFYIGTRATKGVGGRFWLVGPQWTGEAPAGVTVIRSSTNDVWMLARILVDGPDDMAAAKALQQQISVKPVTEAAPRAFGVAATKADDAANFLAVVNEMLARSPGGQGQMARASQFKAMGIGAGATPTAEQIEAWRVYLPKGLTKLREKFLFRELIVNGWGYQEKGVGEAAATDYLRAAIALGGLAALGEEEAMYFMASADASGEALSGARAYRWRVPPGGIPAGAFWSLTMYQAEDDGRFFLTENPIRRYSIGDRTKGLVADADGSIDILIQHQQPTGPFAANWLPSPAGKLRMSLRTYLPDKPLLDRTWKIPPVERVA